MRYLLGEDDQQVAFERCASCSLPQCGYPGLPRCSAR